MTKNSQIEPAGISNSGEQLFDLRMLARHLWRWKWIVVIAGVLGGAFGAKNATEFSPTYQAMMIVQPLDQLGASGASASGGGLLGLARSIGISGGDSTSPSFDLFRVMVGSIVLAQRLQDKYGLMQKVYGSSWDAENKIWIKPKIDENSYRQRLRRTFHLNSWHPPDAGSLAKFIKSSVKVERIRDTNFFKLSVENSEREFALYLLNIVYREVDALIGSNRRQEQKNRREYLKNQIETARLTEVRDSLLSLLMQQEQRAIITNARPPYTVKVIEPLNAPPNANEPPLYRMILVPAGILIAVVMCIATIILSLRNE